MPKKGKDYYAVIEGRSISTPTIFSSWGDVQPRINGYKSIFKGFKTLEKAKQYMKENGISHFEYQLRDDAQAIKPTSKEKKYYGVASGREAGIHTAYQRAEPEVTRFSGACHKAYSTPEQTANFIKHYNESCSLVSASQDRAKIETADEERDLAEGIDKMRI